MARSFKEKQTPEALKKFMVSPNWLEREAAVDAYPEDDKSILPKLVEIVQSDNNLSVLVSAVNKFNALTKQSFTFFQTDDLVKWWNDHPEFLIK